MATTKTDKGRGDGVEGYQASVDALTEFQGGGTIDDPEVGPEGQVIVSPWSQQQLDERILNGEGEAVRQELADAAEGLKSSTHGGRADSKSKKAADD